MEGNSERLGERLANRDDLHKYCGVCVGQPSESGRRARVAVVPGGEGRHHGFRVEHVI